MHSCFRLSEHTSGHGKSHNLYNDDIPCINVQLIVLENFAN